MVCNNIVTNKFITNKIITFNVKQHSLATTRHLFPPFTAGYRHVGGLVGVTGRVEPGKPPVWLDLPSVF